MTWNPNATPEKTIPEATPQTIRDWAHQELGKLDWHNGSDAAFERQLKTLKATTDLLTIGALKLLLNELTRPDSILGSPLLVTSVFFARYTAYKQFVRDTINERTKKGWL